MHIVGGKVLVALRHWSDPGDLVSLSRHHSPDLPSADWAISKNLAWVWELRK